jgi:predicted nucleotidyltransferase
MMTPIVTVPDSIVSLRVFGSFCRGDNDRLSDIDVLVVHANKPEDSLRGYLRATLKAAFRNNVDLAEYSAGRLKDMFAAGHLFTWHLQSESASLLAPPDKFFESLGSPAPYRNAIRDAYQFLDLLETISIQLSRSGSSPIYEAGLLYLASRNVGICASSRVCRLPNFSRYAAKAVCEQIGVPFPLSAADYNTLIDCRLGSIRGLEVAVPAVEWVRSNAEALIDCCTEVCEKSFGGLNEE